MHLGQLLVEAGRPLLDLLDLLLPFLDLQTHLLQLALVLQRLQGAAPLLHDLPEARVGDEPGYHVAAVAEVLDALDVGLDLQLEPLDLSLILKGQFFDSIIEELVLVLLLPGELLVVVEEFDLALEDVLVVGCDRVEKGVLAGVLLDYLLVHLAEVLLGLVYEPGDLPLEFAAGVLAAQLGDALLELLVLVPQLLGSAHTHLNNIQTQLNPTTSINPLRNIPAKQTRD